jgi:hypothetical protein
LEVRPDGRDRLSTVQAALVEAFAGAAVHVNNLNVRLLIGESIDLTEHSAAIGAMVRVATQRQNAERCCRASERQGARLAGFAPSGPASPTKGRPRYRAYIVAARYGWIALLAKS